MCMYEHVYVHVHIWVQVHMFMAVTIAWREEASLNDESDHSAYSCASTLPSLRPSLSRLTSGVPPPTSLEAFLPATCAYMCV